MEYKNYTNKPCRIFIYENSDFKNHIAMIKFKSLAEAYKYLQGLLIKDSKNAPIYWKEINSLSSFRKYCKKHSHFRGAFFTNNLYTNESFYFFSLFQSSCTTVD